MRRPAVDAYERSVGPVLLELLDRAPEVIAKREAYPDIEPREGRPSQERPDECREEGEGGQEIGSQADHVVAEFPAEASAVPHLTAAVRDDDVVHPAKE